MYILTFKSNNSNNFGSIGVFETLKQVKEQITSGNNYIDDYFHIDYKQDSKVKVLKENEILDFLLNNSRQFCSFDIYGINSAYNIRVQDNIKLIK